MARRDATKIILEILAICSRVASMTQIVYRANLNSYLAKRYINALLARDLLFQLSDSKNATVFATTERGERLLNVLVEAEREIGGSTSGLFRK